MRGASWAIVRELGEVVRRHPSPPMAARWEARAARGKGKQAGSTLVPVIDASSAFNPAFGVMKQLPSWSEFEDAWRSDDILGDSEAQTAGFWSPEQILLWVLPKSIALRRSKPWVDEEAVVSSILSLRDRLRADHVEVDARARVFNLRVARKEIALSKCSSLARLTLSEANARQPIEGAFPHKSSSPFLTMHRAELRSRVRVRRAGSMSFVEGSNRGQQEATEEVRRCFEALQLALPGRLELGAIEVSGGVFEAAMGGGMFAPGAEVGSLGPPGQVTARGQAGLRTAYEIIAGASNDRVLQRAARRFAIGRQRRDDVDRVVDYVVAAESLFLTVKGDTMAQELRYRFAVNGTLLLRAAGVIPDAREAFRRLREAYDCRSGIVHGGSDRDASSAREVAAFLEECLRSVMFWLWSRPPEARPYLRAGGWEEMLWGPPRGRTGGR